MLDPTEFGKAMAAIVNEAIGPLRAEIERLKSVQPLKGDPGKDADPQEVVRALIADDELATHIANAVKSYIAANPPKDGASGRDGKDGQSVTVADVEPMIEARVKAAVDAIPRPKDGKDAEPIDVSDVTRELLSAGEIKTLVNMEVADYLQKNPPPKGDPGKSLAVEDVSIFLEAAVSKWALEFERRANDTLAKAIDKIPEPKDGRDGVAMPTLEWDGERTFTVKAASGEIIQVNRLALPLDRGYYRDGMKAEQGDILTHNGDAWIALKDTAAKPCRENSEDWRLFARKGRDGRDGKDGKPPPGPVKL